MILRSPQFLNPKRTLQQGQGAVEYALIIVAVVVAVILAITLFGDELAQVYCQVAGELGGEACGVVSASYCEDEFANNKDWEFTRSGEDSWTFDDGLMCMTKNTYRDYAFSTCSQGMPSDDYVIHLTGATLTSGNGYGVYFRLQGVSETPSGYVFQFDPGASGFVFRRWTNGVERTIAYKRDLTYDYYGEPHDIDIQVIGDRFEAYLDGEFLLSATDSTYPIGTGGVGFRTWSNARVCFENLTIDPIPAQ